MPDLINFFKLSANALGHLTSAVQFGFITGTLIFAGLTLADRFAPSKVFFASAILGSLFNLGMIWPENTITSLLVLRFLTGFFLAGIYPVGMKIAADYYKSGLGTSLGFLVGALVLGTAFPHFLNGFPNVLNWTNVIITTSILAVSGGTLLFLFVPNGPFRKVSPKIDLTAFYKVFKNSELRKAAFGYFGHMWELYAFWAFVPVLLSTYRQIHQGVSFSISLWSFIVIAVGGLACVLGGYLAKKYGALQIARLSLLLSLGCCLIAPFALSIASTSIFIGFLLFWGMVVIADSPLFSTLVALHATPELKGTALTIVNCIGFAITIVSIQLLSYLLSNTNSSYIYMLLAIGPIIGVSILFSKSVVKRSIKE